jgi:phosphoserine aminotransferase
MKKIFFTPGPAALFPGVADHLQQAMEAQLFSLSHRSKTYESWHHQAVQGVKALLQVPEDFQVFFMSSATEIWERLLQNCVQQRSHHFVNGTFSGRFYSIAGQLGLQASQTEAAWGQGFDFDAVELPEGVEMINFTHNETSTGVMLPIAEIARFRERYPQAVISLDMVSSAPYGQPDWQVVDAAYFSVQKCFGLPAGLGVLIAGPRALEAEAGKRAAGHSTGSYHSFPSLLSKAVKNQTPETPNMLDIYLLGKVCEQMLEQGVDEIRAATERKAKRLHRFFETRAGYELFVKEEKFRSATVVVVNVEGEPAVLLAKLAESGLIVGSGYGKMKSQQIRIANFPATSEEAIEGLLEAFSTL